MCFYDVQRDTDLDEIELSLLEADCPAETIDEAKNVLTMADTGFTFTSFPHKRTIIVIGHATSAEQMYDTIQHELKHVTEHISEYYYVDPRGEPAAYLQGEIARNMFPAAASLICPHCNGT